MKEPAKARARDRWSGAVAADAVKVGLLAAAALVMAFVPPRPQPDHATPAVEPADRDGCLPWGGARVAPAADYVSPLPPWGSRSVRLYCTGPPSRELSETYRIQVGP